MDYYHKYTKYKYKYAKLKKHKGGTDKSYQNIIYEIAQYIKPKYLQKFKNEYGLKQLTNQVIELNKINFISEFNLNEVEYYMTDKIDGKRTVLYLNKNESYAVNDTLTNINMRTKDVCILDTEKYEENYYIFDVMVYEGKILNNIPFEERMRYFDNFTDMPNIKKKTFIKLNDEYKEQIRDFRKHTKPYDVDGIIFTPAKGMYETMKVYKYKPPEHLTIDFLIKKHPRKQQYVLFCGISKKVFYKLRMKLVEYYEEIFRNIDTKNLPQYFPIQFEPSSKTNAYTFWSEEYGLDGEVGEFLYENGEWQLKKIRKDRKIEVTRGNYFGNNYKVAEFIWMALSDPLIIEDIDQNTNIYFQEHNNILQKVSRNYNSFVKSELFNRFKGTRWVIDMASGKGQDLFRYSTSNMKNIIFLEIDKAALSELIWRKHSFSTDNRYRNNMHILIQNVNLLDPYTENIKAINNVYNGNNIDLIMCNFAFHYFVKNEESLKNICNLISHYLRTNGKFVFTSFDGQKIIDLLNKNNGEWIINVGDKTKYGIKRKYEDDELLHTGQKIEVLLPFSKNTYYEEYLINIKWIKKELEKHRIVLETNESFSSYQDRYKKTSAELMDKNDKTYIDLYHYYIFIKKDF